MFHRITVEEWQNVMSVVAMILFIAAFTMALMRVFSMRKDQLDHIKNLPLEPETTHDERRD